MKRPTPAHKPSFILGRPGSNQCCLLTMDQCAWRGSVFERGPFRSCPRCRKEATFGLLSVDGSMLTRRCKACMYMNAEPLPPLNKQVVYLDQLAISEIFKVKSGTRSREAHNRKFWEDVERSVTRAYLLQQIIFPASSIHMDETIVAPFAGELRLVHEMLGGDTSFASVDEVEMCQVRVFADAYLQNRPPPQLSFDRDHILEGERNAWLPDLHITVDMDLSHFADRIRASRDATATEFAALAQAWVTEKPTFAQALKHELRSYGSVNKQALAYANSQVRRGIETDNIMDVIGGQNHRIRRQFNELKGRFEEAGIPPDRTTVEVMKY